MTQTQAIQEQQKPKTLAQILKGLEGEMARALPKHISPDRMARVALTALRTTPDLNLCTPASFIGSIYQASQLGLEVNTPLGQAYLIPFRNNQTGRHECQLIIGYQGFMDLARRSGQVSSIYAFPVYDGDRFAYSLGLDPKIQHEPKDDADHDPAKLTHVYAVAKLKSGDPIFTVLTRAEVERYRARSKTRSKSTPWYTDYEAMALKTGIRRLFRWLPKSAEMSVAVQVDQALELGKNQLAESDPSVLGLLEQHGIPYDLEAPTEEPDERQTKAEAKTDELLAKHKKSKAQQREPGDDQEELVQ